jgi:hypothetical protein
MKSFWSGAFLAGLAAGVLTVLVADCKMKKKHSLLNLGVTPATLTKAARREGRLRKKGEERWLRSMST